MSDGHSCYCCDRKDAASLIQYAFKKRSGAEWSTWVCLRCLDLVMWMGKRAA